MPESLVKGVTGHKTDKELQKYIGPMGDTIKTETQKAWNLVTNPKVKKPYSEMSDEDFVNLLKESMKSGKGNKQKLIDYLNSLEDTGQKVEEKEDSSYNPEFIKKIKKSQASKGKVIKIEDLWNNK